MNAGRGSPAEGAGRSGMRMRINRVRMRGGDEGVGKLVTTIALAVLILGAALYTFGGQIAPAAGEAGAATALKIRAAF